ncbi:perilipin-3-like [Sceloporus undulatus]|uniref:perilipin-3-like n=1 Tax=Sceloporus undulatus TaxID=8520 RepID=UPI001C4D6DC0|nr:perilipin-3-like [Sceloporus undulatus]XP_042309441.1 perilipin-3-like [Sceloporus undulatus]
MSSAEETAKAASPKSLKDERLCVIKRVAELPLVSSAYEKVSATYTSAKESHPAIQAVCDRAEVGVKAIASTAASGAQPFLDKFEDQITAVDTLACKSLDVLQETFPVVHQTVDQVVSGARGLLTESLTPVYTRVTEAAQEMAKSAMKIGMDNVMESDVAQMMIYRVGRLLDHSDEWVDEYLPITDIELMDLAKSVVLEDFDEIPMPILRNDLSYYMRLSSLSAKIRRRAYYSTLEKIQQVQRTIDMTLFQFEQYMYMMKFTLRTWEYKFQQGQEKLRQMFQEYVRGWPKRSQFIEFSQFGEEEMASQALKVSQTVAQQMYANCLQVLADMEDLPVDVKEKIQQAQSNAEDLQAAITRAQSFQGVPIPLRHWSSERRARAQQAMEYESRKPPHTGVVEPLSSAGVHSQEVTDPEESAKVVA